MGKIQGEPNLVYQLRSMEEVGEEVGEDHSGIIW